MASDTVPTSAPELIQHPGNDLALREWMECPVAGHPLEGVVSSKCPLSKALNSTLVPQLRYSSAELLSQQRDLGREVGMVIDLTVGDKSCSSEDWKASGVHYVKIPCKGRQEVPDPVSVNKFVYEVVKYFCANRQDGGAKTKCILVHGIHGYNRTGFMIVHYLMRARGGKLAEALQAFAYSRPPGIYKQKYIDSLFTLYNARHGTTFICPKKPTWKNFEEGDSEITSKESGVDTEDNSSTLQASPDDVLGDAIPEEYQIEMQKICYWALELELPSGQGRMISPQSVPLSLSRAHLDGVLLQRYYRTTWKPVAARYMLLICRDGCYLIDADFQFRRVEMRFPRPRKGTSDVRVRTHHYTLLDGEMVLDTDVNSNQIRRFLVSDLLMLNKEHTKNIPFHVRHQLIEDEITAPRNAEDQANKDYYYNKEAFRVRRKYFYNISSMKNMLQEFIPKLSHPADGVIFQDWDGPYVTGPGEGFLQWKFMHHIDFLLKVSPDQGQPHVYLVEDGDKLKEVAVKLLTLPEPADGQKLSDKVIKCAWHPIEKNWKVVDTQTGRKTASSWTEYQKVLEMVAKDIPQTSLIADLANLSRSRLYVARDRPYAEVQKR